MPTGPVCTLTWPTVDCNPLLETQVGYDYTLTLTASLNNYSGVTARVETFLLDVVPCIIAFDPQPEISVAYNPLEYEVFAPEFVW